jgi:hypothetical protein
MFFQDSPHIYRLHRLSHIWPSNALYICFQLKLCLIQDLIRCGLGSERYWIHSMWTWEWSGKPLFFAKHNTPQGVSMFHIFGLSAFWSKLNFQDRLCVPLSLQWEIHDCPEQFFLEELNFVVLPCYGLLLCVSNYLDCRIMSLCSRW